MRAPPLPGSRCNRTIREPARRSRSARSSKDTNTAAANFSPSPPVVGETPNLAARLQALAEPGTVVIAPSTRRLTGGLFDYQDLGAIEIKGLAVPVEAARVVRESGAESRFEALRAARTPLVGRDEELALLQRRWQQAKTGEGCIILISGEPGIGKSRLAQALVEWIAGEPHTRLRTFCSPHQQGPCALPDNYPARNGRPGIGARILLSQLLPTCSASTASPIRAPVPSGAVRLQE
jgi:hypothetical protein